MDEADLIRGAKAGEASAWGRLFDLHERALYAYALARMRNPADAEDIVSQTFLRALRSIRTFQPRGRPIAAWLHRIALNLIRDELRRRNRRPEARMEDLEREPAHAGPDAEFTRLDLAMAVERLKDSQRDVVLLRFYVGLPTREVAAILGKREAAVYSLQVRALESLRRHLKES